MSYNVLIADDSSIIRASLRRILKLSGAPVDVIFEAPDGEKALELLQEQWVDIVITDLHMPRMDGFELIEEMKKSPVLKNISIIVVTSDGSPDYKSLLQSGIEAFLQKPYQVEQIRDAIMATVGE